MQIIIKVLVWHMPHLLTLHWCDLGLRKCLASGYIQDDLGCGEVSCISVAQPVCSHLYYYVLRCWNPGMQYAHSLKSGPKANCPSWIKKFPWIPFLRLIIELFSFKFGVDPEIGLDVKRGRSVVLLSMIILQFYQSQGCRGWKGRGEQELWTLITGCTEDSW